MSKLLTNTTDLQEVLQALQNKAAGGEQATPVISVNTSGLITATAGVKTSTYQLAFQPAKTITPSTASQIAVSSGYYTGGNITVAAVPTQSKSVTPTSSTQNITPDSGKFLSKVTVAGDSNLVASNIKNGVSIFGVSGNYVGSGGGDTSAEDGIITKTISSYTNDRVTSIPYYTFYDCSSLTTVSFPKVTYIGSSAFYDCSSLTTVSFPVATSIAQFAFYRCSSLTTVSFPKVTYIGGSAFGSCRRLTTVSFPVATSIAYYAFNDCRRLTTVSFPKVTYIGSSAFYDCSSLTTVSFPVATSIGSSAFCKCSSLTTVSFPKVTYIGRYAFAKCSSLTTVSFPVAITIGSYAFENCFNLKSLYLTGSSLCKLSNSYAFTSTPIGGYSTSAGTYGSIYVPASLLTSYQTATNWTYFSSRFVAFEGGTTESTGEIITFQINNTEYQALNGMTWREWVDSSYDIYNEFYIVGSSVMHGNSSIVKDNNNNFDLADSIIQPSTLLTYTFASSGGSGN